MESKTKKVAIMTLYSIICLTFITGVFFIKSYMKDQTDTKVPVATIELKPKNKVDDNTRTVFGETNIISKPFIDNDVEIGISFYNNKDEKENQKNSLIYYENTYIPSTGVYYKRKNEFNIISVYNGKISEITNDKLLGNVIKIDYGNNLIGLYQCVNNIKVNVGDNVITGTILGTSSTCPIFSSKGNGFYLELLYNGVSINPELYYGKTKEEL